MTTLSQARDGARVERRRATMRDVAALAGVGIKTVSRVVNGEPGVSPAMAERVTAAARTLNFQADARASNLRRAGRRTHSLGLLLASVDNPFAAAIHRAVEDVAAQRDVAVLSASTDERPEREKALVATFTARRVDGLIITATGDDHSYLQPELDAGTPVVSVDRPAIGIEVDCVVVDNVEGARSATEHLLHAGHRRVAYLGDLPIIATARQRHEGYLSAMRGAGAPVDDGLVIDGLHSDEAAAAAAHRILTQPDPPTAIFASQNLITTGAIHALRALGLHREVALVGFDDFSLADLLEPAVTVVAQDPVAIGRIAAERLFTRMEDHDRPVEQIVLPTRLVVRGSGELPPRW